MLKVGDKFASKAPGKHYTSGLDYKRGDVFEVMYVHSETCVLKHVNSGIKFIEDQYRLHTDFMSFIETSDERYIRANLHQVDKNTMDAIKSLVDEAIEPKKELTIADLTRQLDAHTEILEETVQLVRDQQDYFDKQIKAMKYKAHLHGLTL